MPVRSFLFLVLLLSSRCLMAEQQPGMVAVDGTIARHVLANGGHLNVTYMPILPETGKPDQEARESQIMQKRGDQLLYPPTPCVIEVGLYDRSNNAICFVTSEQLDLSQRGTTLILTKPKVVPELYYDPRKGAYATLTFKTRFGLTYTWPGSLNNGLKARANINPRVEFYYADKLDRPAGRTRVDYG